MDAAAVGSNILRSVFTCQQGAEFSTLQSAASGYVWLCFRLAGCRDLPLDIVTRGRYDWFCTCVPALNITRTMAAIYANGGMMGDAFVQGELSYSSVSGCCISPIGQAMLVYVT